MHCVLLEIYGLGVLLIGDSGVGKSESALDLITRGHSLVADDLVTVKRYPNGELVGYTRDRCATTWSCAASASSTSRTSSASPRCASGRRSTWSIELEHWQDGRPTTGSASTRPLFDILETPCPYIRMPVAIGRNISILVEIAARNHVLKLQGHRSAREFARKLEAQLERNRKGPR